MSIGNFEYDSTLPYDAPQEYNAFSPAPSSTAVRTLFHLAIPFSLQASGSFATVIQDSYEDVSQSVEMVLGSVQGERTVVPTFGLPLQNFQVPDKGDILAAVTKWEPRARANVTVDPTSTGSANVTVGISLVRGTQT